MAAPCHPVALGRAKGGRRRLGAGRTAVASGPGERRGKERRTLLLPHIHSARSAATVLGGPAHRDGHSAARDSNGGGLRGAPPARGSAGHGSNSRRPKGPSTSRGGVERRLQNRSRRVRD